MKLIFYALDGHSIDIHPSTHLREWMDETPHKYAYRCLPLSIANAHGWEIRCPESFEAKWDGRTEMGAIEIAPQQIHSAVSHFGSGVLTFHVPGVFRTEPGWNLIIMGPPNRPKAGIQPLTGVVETDWSPYSFTMNWKFVDTNRTIRFEKGEPFCFLFPVPRNLVESIEPEIRSMRSEPDLYGQHQKWAEERKNFNRDLANPDSEASKKRWQRSYYTGLRPDGDKAPEHQMKIVPKPFKK